MNAVYQRALDQLLPEARPGLSHPTDFGRAVDLFDRLLEADERVDHPEEIEMYLARKAHLTSQTARDARIIYQAAVARRSGRSFYGVDYIRELLKPS